MTADNAGYAQRGRYRTPGVYLEQVVPEGIPEFRTGVPVFVGFAQKADANRRSKCYLLTRWEQFERRIGPALSKDGFLAYAVRGFFQNGGERCVVVPLRKGHGDPAALREPFKSEGLLEDLEDVDLVCVPDVMMAGASADEILQIQQEVLDYCRRMGNRFAILDAFPVSREGPEPVSQMRRCVEQWQALPPADGALYFPWLYVMSLPGSNNNAGRVLTPPCGHVAGIYARTDARVGVHKAPANEVVEGALDLEVEISDADQAELNQAGVNCLRSFPGRGIRVWGARTLSGQPNWRYVNVRRLFLTLSRWLTHNLDDLIFEPNGPPLWERIRQRIGSYCFDLFRRGALKGQSPAEAFFVKCDAETNPLEVRESGWVISEVGLAPVMPAEFVIVRINQSAAGTTISYP